MQTALVVGRCVCSEGSACGFLYRRAAAATCHSLWALSTADVDLVHLYLSGL